MATLVCTVLGIDRPGLVDGLAGVVRDHEGNWERSEMARLGGRFAGIVQVTVPDRRADELDAALRAAGAATGLLVTVDRADAGPGPEPVGPRLQVSLVGADRPGLVHAVASALAEAGANIEELATDTTSAPMSGEPLFEATATVVLPTDADHEALRQRLEGLAGRLMVDIELRD
jgi:glycine cleavage system regulatory protein